jgi:hypothetical protein
LRSRVAKLVLLSGAVGLAALAVAVAASGRSDTATATPTADVAVDHLECYSATATTGHKPHVVVIAGRGKVLAGQPSAYCSPTSIKGGVPNPAAEQLVCYFTSPKPAALITKTRLANEYDPTGLTLGLGQLQSVCLRSWPLPRLPDLTIKITRIGVTYADVIVANQEPPATEVGFWPPVSKFRVDVWAWNITNSRDTTLGHQLYAPPSPLLRAGTSTPVRVPMAGSRNVCLPYGCVVIAHVEIIDPSKEADERNNYDRAEFTA